VKNTESRRFDVAVREGANSGTGIWRWDGINVQMDGVSVDHPFDRQKGIGTWTVTEGIGDDVPGTVLDFGQQFQQWQQGELKSVAARLAVLFAADDFRPAQIQADHPAVVDQLTVETDPADIRERLEELGGGVYEVADPLGSHVTALAIGTISLQLLQQMFYGDVRMSQRRFLQVVSAVVRPV